ncbi:LORF2 protein, partial [Crocuta crocuta]
AKDLNQHFSNRDIQIVSKYRKRCSTSLVTEEMQIAAMMRYHFISTRKSKIKKTENKKCWGGCKEIRTFLHCWKKCKMVQPLWETIWQRTKSHIELPYNPAILLLGIYAGDLKAYISYKACT